MKDKKLVAVPHGKAEEKTMRGFYREIEADVLARTLYGEARGEGTVGMQAVANVVLNRVAESDKRGTYWWGNNVIQVCQKPYQFSCWNRADVNFRKLQAVDEKDLYFATAMRIARRALIGNVADITKGATHYHATQVTPYWARGQKATTTIGNHVFYRLLEV